MAGVKGRSGRNPDKVFADAVRLVVHEMSDDPVAGKRKLRLIAEKLVDKALEGEGWAIQQVADRLDGKPAQESTVTFDDKRDGTDWTRDELVAILNDRRTSSNGAAKTNGRDREPDSVH